MGELHNWVVRLIKGVEGQCHFGKLPTELLLIFSRCYKLIYSVSVIYSFSPDRYFS